ncbi:Vitelline membrane outer layer protein 1 [Orchesella cincta]|uniref:Vitelline membrane outer layer protein 1 n=1 Tax=Orchesella cincta TaxID=48709 RepID=A0A1D2MH23_ORCCI|nr:Vitelline membrane outer layer protein 1 [Orchesella cincta]
MIPFQILPIFMFSLDFVSAAKINITSPHLTNWGRWGSLQRCPSETYAQGFQLKTERYLYIDGDDTALNSIKLFCGDPTKQGTPSITSTEGFFGVWGKVHTCFPGFLTGFQLRVMPNAKGCGDGDNFAATNIRFFCTNGELEGDGINLGNWGQAKYCGRNQSICGIQTQVEAVQAKLDDTSLNNVLMECCDVPPTAPLIEWKPEDEQDYSSQPLT